MKRKLCEKLHMYIFLFTKIIFLPNFAWNICNQDFTIEKNIFIFNYWFSRGNQFNNKFAEYLSNLLLNLLRLETLELNLE